MSRTTVDGKLYVARRLGPEDIRPGTLVRGQENRRVYRIVCEDAGDLILRNVRHPDLLETACADELLANCWRLVPA